MTSTHFDNPIVLAVDDDVDDTDLLRLLLRKAGVPNPVEIYREGEEIIKALSSVAQKALKPLLCILDVKMPGMTGHEVLRWIRSQRSLDNMPVIMLSSSEHPDDIKQAAQNGAQCYLTKYPQPAVLREVIDEAGRFADGVPASECFRLPSNQLLVRWRRVNDLGGKAGR